LLVAADRAERQTEHDAAFVRVRSVFNLALIAVSWPVAVLWHGLPVLWEDYPKVIRREALTLWRGKTGPYRGIVW
jgi:hypothetical protein